MSADQMCAPSLAGPGDTGRMTGWTLNSPEPYRRASLVDRIRLALARLARIIARS
ncbi:hypothetical protein GA0070622_1174 [Micromonospora sediminicola]|uniref:Uncharacterized protein n=1 Tax=Micromonospora sediminicola TaxID=946078 RepID=A0A1A9B597_9ACTN|nr:hypothetical protein GA0070622_1174 [Micromonospora sediminicola]